MKTENNIVQVLKFKNEYYEVGEVISVIYDSYMCKPIIGRIIELSNLTINGVITCGTIKLDTSDKYNSKIETLHINRIQDIERCN